MKRIWILLLATAISLAAAAQNEVIDKYADVDGVTSVYISKEMFSLIKGDGNLIEEMTGMSSMSSIVNKLEGLQLLTTDEEKVARKLDAELSFGRSNGYTELMRIKDDDAHTNVYRKELSKGLYDYVLLVKETDGKKIEELTVIVLTGTMTPEEIRGIIDAD